VRSLALPLLISFLVLSQAGFVLAQSDPNRFELGAQVATATSNEFDANDIGFGGRFSWNPLEPLGLESEINFYPKGFPDQVPFSRMRIEGLFGATVGPRLGRARPFAKVRTGFVRFRPASEPFACILIFPPPLACQLGGRTLAAFDVGGGLELFPAPRIFVRVEAGDRAIRYPGPARDDSGTLHQDSFFSHDFRFAAGAGLRF
jgi:hypothetical protein